MAEDKRSILDLVRFADQWQEKTKAPAWVEKLNQFDRRVDRLVNRWGINTHTPTTTAPTSYYIPEEPPAPPATTPTSKTDQQKTAILQEIQTRGWNPHKIPKGGVEELKKWFIPTFNRSEGVFRSRWTELRQSGQVDTRSMRGKKSGNSKPKIR